MNTDTFKDYYKLLGIEREAVLTQIRSAYKKLALEYHPDKNKNNEEAGEKFREILEAYEILSDPTTKVDYDSEYDYETGNSTSKPKKRFRESKGGLEAPIYTDYRGEAYQTITDAITINKLWVCEEVHGGQNMFDASGHRYCKDGWEFNYWGHIYVCLDTQSEVNDFRSKMLGLVATYIADLAKLKEESLARYSKHFRSKRSKLTKFQKKLLTERYRIYSDGPIESWEESVQRACFTKDLVLGAVNRRIELIDSYVEFNRRYENPDYQPNASQKETEWKRVLEEDRKGFEDESKNWEKETKERGDIPEFTWRAEKNSEQKTSKLRKEVFQKICEKLTGAEPIVSSSELDSNLWSPFSSWIDKLWKLEFDQLEDFQEQMLKAISQNRKEKRKEGLRRVFDEAKNETGSKLEEKIEQADKNYGSQSYWDNEDLVKGLKTKSARENLFSYRQRVFEKIEEEMERSGVREEELGNKVQAAKNKLVSGEVEEPSLVVEFEMTVISGIKQVEANKNLDGIINQVEQALVSRSQKAIKRVKNQILEFISNPNVFCQNSYNDRKSEVQNYLSKLESYSPSEGPINSDDSRLPLNVVVPIAVVLLLVMLLGFSFIRQKNKERY
jgi:curved DNA-binding protein CbpA